MATPEGKDFVEFVKPHFENSLVAESTVTTNSVVQAAQQSDDLRSYSKTSKMFFLRTAKGPKVIEF